MPFASVHRLPLHYEQAGAGPEPLVFLHGLGSAAHDWPLQVAYFSDRYRVITLDLRGHGQSARVGLGITVEALAQDVAALLHQLQVGPAHVVGLSLGGCVAQRLAGQSPAQVRTLVLVNTFARLRPAGWRGAGRIATRVLMLLSLPMPRVAAYVARGLFPKPEQAEFRAAACASLGQNSKRTYFAGLLAVARFDSRPDLPALRCPTLVVAGDRDLTIPLVCKETLARLIPGAQLSLIPDSGHATPYDQAEIFNRQVGQFLAAH